MGRTNSKYILAKFDVSGIQSYIFATNRLRENVGASYQVTRILEEYLPYAIKDEAASQEDYVLEWKNEGRLCILEKDSIKTEIIYIGGGNAMVLFGDKQMFERVCRNLGRKVAENCQGIYLIAAYKQTSLENFKQDVAELGKSLAAKKSDIIRQPIYSPFPVVEQDNSDHQPITRCYQYKNDGDGNSRNSRIIENMTEMRYQKRISYEWSKNNRDKKLYPVLGEGKNYDYPVDMDHLCSEERENSYIAVVHIDGNDMGRQIQEALRTDKEYADAVCFLRNKSKEISDIFKNAYKVVLLKLCEHTELLRAGSDGGIKFPLRPIVMDGDDFTFLCTADLAIPIAAGFLTELSKCQKEKTQKITACAGIAFVHSHFPFYEAYCIAEDACASAKNKWYKESKENENRQVDSFLDFRVLKGSEVGGIQKHEEWQLRPYHVAPQSKVSRNDSLIHLYNTIKQMEDKWPSNRLHRLYQAMLDGEEQMQLLEKEFISRKYDIKELVQGEDWRYSALYDALELRGLCETELLADFFRIQEK